MRVLFVADQFADAKRSAIDTHPGGAELTDAAAIAACPWRVEHVLAAELEPRWLRSFDVHVVANAERASTGSLEALAATRRHVCFEHDLRPCRWRGNYPAARGSSHRLHWCTCRRRDVLALCASALGLIWLTRLQRRHFVRNPWFRARRGWVLGSPLFADSFLRYVRERRHEPRYGWAVHDSPQRIKGTRAAVQRCRERGVEPERVRNLAPEQVWERLSRCERFVYLPEALEPAGRMVVEARLCGAEVTTNDHVGVLGEPWWQEPDERVLARLEAAPLRFWEQVERLVRTSPDRC